IYISTGSHFFIVSLSKGLLFSSVHGYLKKYHAESRNVSETSVSRFAELLHFGHLVCTNFSTEAKGDLSVPVGRKSFTFGSNTGKSFSGTGTVPCPEGSRRAHLSQ